MDFIHIQIFKHFNESRGFFFKNAKCTDRLRLMNLTDLKYFLTL